MVNREQVQALVQFPSARWPGESRDAIIRRAAAYIIIWLIFEILIGVLFPILELLVQSVVRGFAVNLAEMLGPREISLVCVALAATRLPDLLKKNGAPSAIAIRSFAALLMAIIVATGSLVSADITESAIMHKVQLPYSTPIAYVLLSITFLAIAFVWGARAAEEGITQS
jgi:hypothetical protein